MSTTIIIYLIFLLVNSSVLLLIWYLIARWMKRTEEKLDGMEHTIRSIDDYIKYTKHVTDIVYLNYLEGLQRIFVSKERYEDAEKVKQVIQIREKIIMENLAEWERK